MNRIRRALAVTAILPLLFLLSCRSAEEEPGLMVAAAMSLRNVMPELMQAFQARTGAPELRASYAASGNLRRQVEGGAPIDVVVFADAASVDGLIENDLAARETRRVVATNVLVLIGPKGGDSFTFETVDNLPDGDRLSIGEPGAAPVGRYARQALQNLHKWDKLSGQVVFGGHVGAVLSYARRGEVAAAVVYRTDIRGIDDIVVMDEAEGDWAPSPEVVAAVVADSRLKQQAREFLDFLSSPRAEAIFRSYGFGVPLRPPQPEPTNLSDATA